MNLDKKVVGGEIKFVLARKLGSVEIGQRVPLALLTQTLNALAKPGASRRMEVI
jgi:3-dehydroquinate synthetase